MFGSDRDGNPRHQRYRDSDRARYRVLEPSQGRLLDAIAELAHDFAAAPEQIGLYLREQESRGGLDSRGVERVHALLTERMGRSFADHALGQTAATGQRRTNGRAVVAQLAQEAAAMRRDHPAGRPDAVRRSPEDRSSAFFTDNTVPSFLGPTEAATLTTSLRAAGSPIAAADELAATAPTASVARAAASPAAVQMKRRAAIEKKDAKQIREEAADGLEGTGERLPHFERIQEAFGAHDVTTVQAHIEGAAGDAAAGMGAEAYAAGEAIAFRRRPDLRTAAHEAAHVVQQRGGVQLSDGVGHTGDRYERHADRVAAAVVDGGNAEVLLDQYADSGALVRTAGDNPVQRLAVEVAAPPWEEGGETLIQLQDTEGLEPLLVGHIMWSEGGHRHAIACFVIDAERGLCRANATGDEVERALAAGHILVEFPERDEEGRFASGSAIIDERDETRASNYVDPVDDPDDEFDSGDFGARRQIPEGYWLGQAIIATDVEGLARDGIRVVVDLDDSFADPEAELEAQGIRRVGVEFGSNLSVERARQVLGAVDSVSAPDEVLIHCRHGADRTGAVVAMLLVLRHGWTVEDAMHAMVTSLWHDGENQVTGLTEAFERDDTHVEGSPERFVQVVRAALGRSGGFGQS